MTWPMTWPSWIPTGTGTTSGSILPGSAGTRLQGADVRYYSLDKNGDIDQLILYEVTGDTYTYAYVTRRGGPGPPA